MVQVPTTGPGPTHTARGAGWALALLLAINMFNYIDRQVLSAVLPKLELDAELFDPTDPWLKTKLGSLTTAFLVTYMLVSPIFGALGDGRSRWLIVGLGVMSWSLASGGSGLATSFLVLLLTRCFVGIGEAAYGPVAPSMISDLYPERKRGQALAWFYMAIPVGSALGFVIGGQVADTAWGWRGAFQVVVLPGLLLGVLCFFMKEPPRPVAAQAKHSRYLDVLKELRGIRSFVMCSVGMTCTTFVLGGVAAWAPYYIFEREARFMISADALTEIGNLKATNGVPLVPPEVLALVAQRQGPATFTAPELKEQLKQVLTAEQNQQYQSRLVEGLIAPDSIKLGTINLIFGAILVLGGLVATLFGGWLGDWLRGRVKGSYFQVSGIGALLGFPCFIAMLYVPFPYAWGCVFAAIFFLFVNTGPANTILANVTRTEIRATAFAMNILVIHLFGDAISPPLIGFITDLRDLSTALLLISVLIVAAGIIWCRGAKYLDEETRHISAHEGS
jgi:MFS family permease